MLIKLMGDEHPDYLAVAFDLGRPTVRLEKYADYKAGRAETPTDFTSQLGLIDEVLDTLHVPMVRVVDHEADDAIGTLATVAADSGLDAVIVTADRDFFQLVRPGIQVMFNRRGISDIVLYDEAGVEERFGVPPSKYLEYVALKGDPSDNIPGVPGVGEKTATKLIQQYGSVEELLIHADELRGKLKDNVVAAADQLALNKELARIVTDLPLDIGPEDCVLGEWDPDEVRRLFTSLEFRSLLDRLEEIGVTKPKVEVTELDLRETSADELAQMIASDAPKGVRLDADLREVRGAAASPGGAQAAFAAVGRAGTAGRCARVGGRAEVDARREGAGARGDRRRRGGRGGGVRHVPRRLSARPRGGGVPVARVEREVPGRRCPRRDRGAGRGPAVQRRRLAAGRGRRGGDRVARSGDGGADRQAGTPRSARDGGDAARVGARPHGRARRGPRCRLPGRDGRGGSQPDGGAPDRDLPRGR